ncbi:flavin reductase family protein [Alkalihalobacillus sp. LMS6]|uniref:flavin reductase family protein n=1 Tax=Alkalihalobacillus sp. LMS6 TaxID=2924034 RepID=UPI0020D10854|nr:flavin reductase family protein [Alkalihalobacillus sp. LMS6]UTR08458.1 flavin reductase family protein [Alkalihalobacillus sp. LMS6]
MDSQKFRKAMGKFTTGVTVIATETEKNVYGMTANAFMSLSLDPQMIVISVGEKAKLKGRIQESGKFSVNILADNQQELSMLFAGQIKEKKEIDFAYLEGTPIIPKAVASIACEVSSEYLEGDHTLFVGKVLDIQLEDEEPLVFYSGKYRALQGEEAVLLK